MKTSLQRRAALCALLAGSCLTAPALAQAVNAPRAFALDERGVDLASGRVILRENPLTFGNGTNTSLYYQRTHTDAGWRNNLSVTLARPLTNQIKVIIDSRAITFNLSGGVWSPSDADGQTLVETSTSYMLTRKNGDTYIFTKLANQTSFQNDYVDAHLTTLQMSGGEVLTFYYKIGQINLFNPPSYESRLQSVTSSSGYQILLEYGSDVLTDYPDLTAWWTVSKVTAINRGMDYCDPTTMHCSGTLISARSVSYTNPSMYDVIGTTTEPDGSVTAYEGIADGYRVRHPAVSGTGVSYHWNYAEDDPRVVSVSDDAGSWAYTWYDDGIGLWSTTTDSTSRQSSAYADRDCGVLLASWEPGGGPSTNYHYGAQCRLTDYVLPSGAAVYFSYDPRGNVTQTRRVSATPGTPADIITSADFPVTCANLKTCNKPVWTKDEAGNQTDYTYDPTHGGLLTITLPAASSGSVRPQKRFTYSAPQAFFKNSAGSIVASGTPTYLLATVAECQTLASCTGSADEVKTTFNYGAQTSGIVNNLLPASVSQGSGDGSLTATTAFVYDPAGNPIYVDGPLAGASDTTRSLFDNGRQLIGQIGPDPDGGGPLKNRAIRLTYRADGQVSRKEQGTTSGQTDAAWAAFSGLQQVDIFYADTGRKSSDQLSSAGTIYSVTQYSQDAAGRPECTAIRMNAAAFSTLPSSACLLGVQGSYGPDRITEFTYDEVGRLAQQTSGYGTVDAGNDASYTYTLNAKVQTFTDGEGHVTTFEYDGFDRLLKTRYPNASGGGSSTTDYELFAYGDPRSLVTSRRLRDGQLIAFNYDALSRPTVMDLPGVDDISYGYDLLGRLKTSSNPSGHITNYGYDALGRVTSEQTTYGSTKTSEYDLAGRRTRFNWGSAWADYDRLVTGEVSAIRENGATSGAGVLATYTYDDLGRRKLITRGNGTTTGYDYDPASRLSSLSQDLAGSTNDLNVSFGYNPAGQIVSRTGNNDAYAYTGHGNQDLTETSNGRNQLTAQGSINLTYGRGNVTAIGASGYTYDARNQLITAAGKTVYYDPPGRIDLILNGSAGTRFDFDGTNLFMEKDYPTSAVLRRFVPGPSSDEPLVWYEGSGTATRRWFHADERGSIIAVSDASGNAIGLNKYDEYGQPQGTLTGRFGYTGQAWLPEIGLQYSKARMYHPGIGRFMQTDPIGYSAGQNLYGYVAGDPVNATDSTGLEEDGCLSSASSGSTCIVTGRTDYSTASFGNSARTPRGGDLLNRDLEMQAELEHALSAIDDRIRAAEGQLESDDDTIVVAAARSPVRPGICTSAILAPPGTCSLANYEWLRLRQKLACSQVRACTDDMSLPELQDQIRNRMACADARQKLNNQCFKGGDAGHKRAIEQMWEGVQKCQQVGIRKYGTCPVPW